MFRKQMAYKGSFREVYEQICASRSGVVVFLALGCGCHVGRGTGDFSSSPWPGRDFVDVRLRDGCLLPDLGRRLSEVGCVGSHEHGSRLFSQSSWTGSFSQASLYLRVRAVPQSAPRDEDGDGLDDVFELSDSGFDPLDASDGLRDTDGDGMPDGWEMMYGLLPGSNSDAMNDSDNDGLSNLQEFLFRTSPFACDTDRDGQSVRRRGSHCLDPLQSATAPADLADLHLR